MDTSAIAQTGWASGGRGQAVAAPVIESDFETFLKMLTTQMQNQDPLNPMEATDFAVQLATFSSVEQQVRTNQLLEGLVTQAGMADLVGLVGMTARAPVAAQYRGAPVEVAFAPAPGADAAELVVLNSLGSVVDSIALAPDARSYSWSGIGGDGTPMPNGRYSFELLSRAGGEVIASGPAEVYAPIVEARRDGLSTTLILHGGVEVALDEITALRGADDLR